MTPRTLISGALLIAGALLAVAGLAGVFLSARTRSQLKSAVRLGVRRATKRSAVVVVGIMLLLIAVGAVLRLDDLDAKTLTHTEAIVPNLHLPEDVSWPPPRYTFYDTFWWHFHSEGHPPAYYLAMWAWTELFGTGLTALRLLSALFGIGCIPLVFGVGSLAYRRRVGLLAAGLLAFSGIHIYWSQYARMYSMACFVTLLSTYLLLRVFRPSKRPHLWAAGYVAVSILGLYTQTFFWTVLVAQGCWVLLQSTRPGWQAAHRVVALQVLVAMIGAPELARIVYLGNDVTLPGPSISFLAQYLSFGFLFEPDLYSDPPHLFPLLLTAPVAALALLLVIGGSSIRVPVLHKPRKPPTVSQRSMIQVAVASVLLIVAFAGLAHGRNFRMMLATLVALGSIMILGLLAGPTTGRDRRWRLSAVGRSILFVRDRLSLPLMLAVLPPVGVFVLSYWTSMLAPRAFLLFVPYLLIVIAAGIWRLSRVRTFAYSIGVVVVVIHVLNLHHFKQYPSEQRDYAALGRQMSDRIAGDDLVFVVPEEWFYAPLYYYLDDIDPSYVAAGYAESLRQNPDARVWILQFHSRRWGAYPSTTPEMMEAVDGMRIAERLTSLRAEALLYVRDE